MSKYYSMNEKIGRAQSLAVDVGELINDGELRVNQEQEDTVFGHADGLSARRLWNIRDGKCSLATTMAFDFEKEEANLDSEIEMMESLLKCNSVAK